jgi:hypothetical protein
MDFNWPQLLVTVGVNPQKITFGFVQPSSNVQARRYACSLPLSWRPAS